MLEEEVLIRFIGKNRRLLTICMAQGLTFERDQGTPCA